MTDDSRQPAAPRPHHHPARFATTHWSVVLAAGTGRAAPDLSRAALEELCTTYWYPLYVYVRGRGHNADEAQDLTQSFFARLLEKSTLKSADPERGRFRSFLLTSLKNFLANEWDRAVARKRGGGEKVRSLDVDFDGAERRYAREPSDTLTPDRLFERGWAVTLLDGVLKDLGAQYTASGKADWFERLKPYLAGDAGAPAYSDVATALATTTGAVQVAVHRLRKRYRDLLREHISQTVESDRQVDEEIRDLFKAVRA